jgi:Chitobiase/beta-hexosaminidase C-terminal domain
MTESETLAAAGPSTRYPLRRVVVVVAMCSVVVLILAVAAVAFFTAGGTGSATAVVGSVTPATISATSSNNGTVTVTWTAQAGVTPVSLDNKITYTVLSEPASGSFAQVAWGSCSNTLADGTTSCSDSSVTSNGSYYYEVIANLGSFTAISNIVPVNVQMTPPTDSVSLVSPAGAYLNTATETVYVNTKTGGSFGLVDEVQAIGAAPGSASFPGIAASGWSGHTRSETVSTGTGSAPTITYASSTPYSFSASAAATTGTVSSADSSGDTSAGVTLTFAPVSSGPSGGSLSAAGTVGTSAGASVLTSAASFPLSWSNFSAGASGVASSSLTVKFAPWSLNACGSYGSGTTITTSSPSTQMETSGDGCYQYTLAETDNVGLTSTLMTTVEVDTTSPVTTDNTGSIGGGWQSSAQTVTLSPTDAGSGVATTYFTTDGTTPGEIGGVPQGTTRTGISVLLASSGTFTIKYFSVDKAGNAEAVKTAGPVIRIDLVSPSVPAPIVNGHA